MPFVASEGAVGLFMGVLARSFSLIGRIINSDIIFKIYLVCGRIKRGMRRRDDLRSSPKGAKRAFGASEGIFSWARLIHTQRSAPFPQAPSRYDPQSQ